MICKHMPRSMIGEMENLTGGKQEILEIAAVIHDIACPVSAA